MTGVHSERTSELTIYSVNVWNKLWDFPVKVLAKWGMGIIPAVGSVKCLHCLNTLVITLFITDGSGYVMLLFRISDKKLHTFVGKPLTRLVNRPYYNMSYLLNISDNLPIVEPYQYRRECAFISSNLTLAGRVSSLFGDREGPQIHRGKYKSGFAVTWGIVPKRY